MNKGAIYFTKDMSKEARVIKDDEDFGYMSGSFVITVYGIVYGTDRRTTRRTAIRKEYIPFQNVKFYSSSSDYSYATNAVDVYDTKIIFKDDHNMSFKAHGVNVSHELYLVTVTNSGKSDKGFEELALPICNVISIEQTLIIKEDKEKSLAPIDDPK